MAAQRHIAELSRLFSLEVDAAHAYAAAVGMLPPGPVRDEIALFGLEHQRHAVALAGEIVRRGHHPPEVTPDVKGVVIGALTPPGRRLTVEDVLEGLRGNEQLSGAVYARVLARGLPDDLVEPISRMHADERQHLGWIERALSRRAWERGALGR